MKKLLLPLLLTILYNTGISQILLYEDFEPRTGYTGGTVPPGWTQEFVKDYETWEFKTGGHWSNPETAAQGDYNAAFIVESPLKESTKLITPPMDMSSLIRPKLTFYLTQETWWVGGNPYNDELRLFYKKSFSGNWIPILGAVYTSGINEWTEKTVYLDSLDLSTTYYIAFEGTTGYGHGTCIDSVVVEEAGLVSKEVSNVIVEQASTSFIATGTQDNPILKLNIKTLGNEGQLLLEDIIISSLNSDDSEISPSGVKLFYTATDKFYEATQLSSGVDFSSGVATFSGVNHELSFGSNYLWVTYDVESGALPENVFDAKIDADAISISGNTYPAIEMSPVGNRSIQQTMIFDGFEVAGAWNLFGFEIGMPEGMGGYEGGNSDPVEAAKGVNVLRSVDSLVKIVVYGVNEIPVDTVIDSLSTNYRSHMTDREYYAISPTLNCDYYIDVRLSFDRWLNIEIWDDAFIDISTDNEVTWTNIWKSGTNFVTDNTWNFQEIDISHYADRKDNVKLRYSLGATSADKNYSGWNIDNFIITANFINSDVSVTEWIYPQSSCGLSSNDSIVVKVANFAGEPTNDTIPIEFSIDGGTTFIRDTIFGIIPIEGDTIYTFRQRVDLSTPGYYQTIAQTVVADDEFPANDVILGPNVFSVPTYGIPYETDFEANGDFWEVQGAANATWEWGNPSGTLINETSSGINAWVTDLDGRFNLNESSAVVSPCFDFTGINYPVFEFKAFYTLDEADAGFTLQYSMDAGISWNPIPKDSYGYSWNWMNSSTIVPLMNKLGDGNGWSGIHIQWNTYRVFLPSEIANANGVKFRIAFESSNTGNRTEGVAFDDVKIYNAPIDVGVVSLDAPGHNCELSNSEAVTVTIENFGLDSLFAGDEIIVGMDFKKVKYVVDTFLIATKVAPGETVQHTFSKTINVFKNNKYYIDAYTKVPQDTAFYEVLNDSIADSVVVYGLPEYNVGKDYGSKTPELEILDAGAGYYAYNWSTGSTTQTTAIPGPGTYFVTVTNDSLCTAVDDITVVYSAKDMSCTGILDLTHGCAPDFTSPRDLKIQVKCIKNAEADSIFFDTDNVYFGYQINDEPEVLEQYISTDTLFPDSSMAYTFSSKLDMTTYGDYDIRVFTLIPDDINIANDESSVTIANWGYPDVNLGDSVILTAQPDTIVFNAGAGFDTYLWQDGSDLETYSVSKVTSEIYSVTVTDTYGCGSDVDTVKIYSYDVGIDSVVGPVSGCLNTSTDSLRFSLTNHGKDTLLPNHPIKVAYLYNNIPPFIEETFFAPDSLYPDSSIVFTFLNSDFDLSGEGTYNFKLFSRLDNDINYVNNIVIYDVNTYGYPVVDIGYDTIFTANRDTVFLNATANRDADYLWNAPDQSGVNTNPIFDVVNPQSFYYKVTVTANGCSVKDSTLLWLKDLAVNQIQMADELCELSNEEHITVTIKNPTNDYFNAGEFVELGLAIDEKHIIYDTLTFASYFGYNATVNFTFSEPVDLSSKGFHRIRCFIASKYDVNSNNDTLIKNIEVVGYPEPDMGLPDTIFTTEPDSIVLSVQNDFDTYKWQDNSLGATYPNTITNAGLYAVTVSWSPGCPGVDSVRIVAYDIAVSGVSGIENSCLHSDSETLTVDIYNPGSQAVPSGANIVVGYTLDGITYTDTIVLASDLPKNGIVPHNFTDLIDASLVKQYDLQVWCSYVDDFKRTNDTLLYSFSTLGNPEPDFGPDTIHSTQPDTLVLKSTVNFFRYIWNDGTNDSDNEYFVSESASATYLVTVVENYGGKTCQTVDTITILNKDLALEAINAPLHSCTISATEEISFKIKNIGADSFVAGTKIYADLYVDEVFVLTDSITLNADLASTETVDIVFDDTYDFTVKDSFALVALIRSSEDFITATNSLNDTLENWGFETVDIGFDQIVTSQPDTVVLILPDTYITYLWSDNITTTNIFSVPSNETRYWSVTTTDIYGCIEKDSVLFITRALAFDSVTVDTASCDFGETMSLSAVFKNAGADVLPAGTTIGFDYNWADSASRYEYFELLSADLAPAATIEMAFPTELSIPSDGVHVLEINAHYVFGNDTITLVGKQDIYKYVQPDININNGLDTIKEVLPVILRVENGYATYEWSTTAIDTFAIAEQSGWYYVTVTSADGCFDIDSALVAAFEIGLNQVIYPLGNICSEDFTDHIEISVSNNGVETLPIGYQIPLQFELSIGSIQDSLVLDAPLAPNGSIQAIIEKPMGIVDEGTYTLKIWLESEIDIDRTNDTISSGFSYYLTPEFQLANGQNAVTVMIPNFINGPSDYATYKWHDGSTLQDIDIRRSGMYTLTVTNAAGCSASDSVNVTVLNESGISEIAGNRFTVYPLPASDILTIDFEEALTADISISFVDNNLKRITGDLQFETGTKEIDIDISELKSGVYYMQILSGDTIYIKKILIK